jgi:hypothetical protein
VERRLQDLGATESGLDVLDPELPDRRPLEVVPLDPGFDERDPARGSSEGDREPRKACPGPEIDETRLVGDQRSEPKRVEDQASGDTLTLPVSRQVDPRCPGEYELDQGGQPVGEAPIAEAELLQARRQEAGDLT